MRMHELIENVPIFFSPDLSFYVQIGCFKLTRVFSRKLGTFTLSLFLDFLIKSPLIFFPSWLCLFKGPFSYLFGAKFTGGKIHR